MRSIARAIIVGVFSSTLLHASTEEELKTDLKVSLTELGEVRAKIAEEKPLLGKKIADLEQELILLRRQQRLARMSAEGRLNDMKALRKNHAIYTQDASYLSAQMKQHAVVMGTQLLPGENGEYSQVLEQIATRGQDQDLDSQVDALSKGVDRLEQLLGGFKTQGNAVTEQDQVLAGEFAHVGPATWFAANDGSVAGPVLSDVGAKSVKVLDGDKEAIAALLGGKEVDLSIDVTGGKARAIAEIQSGFGQLLKKGGVWLMPILGIALLSAICGVIKLLQLMQIKSPRQGWVSEILSALRDGRREDAEEIAASAKHPAGELLKNALQYTSAGADVVEEVIYEQLIGVQGKLQSWLPFIAVTAATAPLLGLLGTVSGMIRMFNVITVTGTGDVKPMAGGISEALVTTLFGLIVAIPALIIHTLLSRRSNGVVQNTEKLGLTLVNGLRKMNQR